MPFCIQVGDISKANTDAIVNPANNELVIDGGTGMAILRQAGEELEAACRKIGGCDTGGAVWTPGFGLAAKYVIHTVGPVWQGGDRGEEELLRSCYRKSLALAKELGCGSISFPLLSSGIFGYPKAEALRVATDTVSRFLLEDGGSDMEIRLIVYDREAISVSAKLYEDIASYIHENGIPAYRDGETAMSMAEGPDWDGVLSEEKRRREERIREAYRRRMTEMQENRISACEKRPEAEEKDKWRGAEELRQERRNRRKALRDYLEEDEPAQPREKAVVKPDAAFSMPKPSQKEVNGFQWVTDGEKKAEKDGPLASVVEEETFSERLIRLIDERGLEYPEVYHKANVDKKLFSKIKTHSGYQPKRETAIAFALSLELNLEETQALLETAGYTLGKSVKFDLIIRYFIDKKKYDIFEIDEVLFDFNQPTLSKA